MEYLEVLIAALAAFALGALWYTAFFGKYWQRQTGITPEQASKKVGLTHGIAFLAMLGYAYCVQTFWGAHFNEDPSFSHGAYHAVRYGIMFALPAMIINYAYQRRSLGLFLVDATYIMIIVLLMSALISIMTLWDPAAEVLSSEELKESIEWAEGYLKEKQDALNSLSGN
jgi:hypothetical protein